MDTTEELNGTYFYAGRPNLTAGELFFMIICEEVAAQLGVDDLGAIVANRYNTIARGEDKLW
nr:hypothetical protein [Pantoea stewartii]